MANISQKTEDGSAVKISSFVREGLVGGWKEMLTPSMNERLEKKIRELLEPVCPEIVDKWRHYGIMTS